MKKSIEDFVFYMTDVKKMSLSTVQSYQRDLNKMRTFMESIGIDAVDKVTVTNINAYILKLEKDGMSAATISRNIAAMRSFFRFLLQNKQIDYEPVEFLKAPPVEKKLPSVLSIEEVERILNQPDESTLKGIRDKAMLELLYATGIRVSEIVLLKASDLSMEMDYVICRNQVSYKDRVIPFGKSAKRALSHYFSSCRDMMVKDKDSDILFVNCKGKPMSRQGFWKIIKEYGEKAGITSEINPIIIRHSFATHMVSNGADLKSIQEMMGLSDISSARIYEDVKRQRLRTVYDKTHPRN